MAQPMDLSPAGMQLGLGSMLADQSAENAEELRRRRKAQTAGRPDLAGNGYGSSILGRPVPLGFGGLLR
jgi:hypothetical protein